MHRTLKREVELLPNLVRMVDLMIVTALNDVIQKGLGDLLSAFDARGVVTTSASLVEGGRSFTPGKEEVQLELSERFLEQILDVAERVPRLLHNPQFLILFQKQIGRKALGPDLRSIVLTSREISRARMALDRAVAKSYAEADSKTAVLEELREIEAFGRTWNREEYARQEKDMAQFRKDMMLMRAWHQQVGGERTRRRRRLVACCGERCVSSPWCALSCSWLGWRRTPERGCSW